MAPYIWQGPLTKSGVIDVFQQKHLTPGLGSEFLDLDLAEVLQSPNADALFRDLAITSKSALQLNAKICDTTRHPIH